MLAIGLGVHQHKPIPSFGVAIIPHSPGHRQRHRTLPNAARKTKAPLNAGLLKEVTAAAELAGTRLR